MSKRGQEHPVPMAVKAVYKKAVELNKRGEYMKARRVLSKLVSQYPREPRLLNSLANTYARIKEDREKAFEYYLRALEYAPDFSPVLNNLSALYSALSRFDESAEYARRAIKSDRESPASWNALGVYYARKGNVKIALTYFLASYSFDNKYLIAAFNAACALTELGRLEEALKYLDISLGDIRLFQDVSEDRALAPLREHPDFKKIVAEAAERLGQPWPENQES